MSGTQHDGLVQGIKSSYEIGKELGAGAQADVSKAIDRKTGKICAIKRFLKSAKACKREIEFLQLLSHASIIRYIDHDTAYTFVALEWVEGGTLNEQHGRKAFTHRETETMVLDVLEALAYVHSHGVIHHDLKPANILVEMRTDDNLAIKLIDFGLANEGPHPKRPAGTPRYAAPEIFTYHISSEAWTGKIDVWSLRLVALEILYGLPPKPQAIGHRLPFQADDPYAKGWHGAIQVQLKRMLKFHVLSSPTPELLVELFTMLEVDPKLRFSSRKARMHLCKDIELENLLPMGMDHQAKSMFEEMME